MLAAPWGVPSSLERRLAFMCTFSAIFDVTERLFEGCVGFKWLKTGGDGVLTMKFFSHFWWRTWCIVLVFLGVFMVKAPSVRSQRPEVRPSRMRVVFVDGGMHSQSMYSHPFKIFKDLGWDSTFYSVTDLLTLGVDALFEKNAGIFVFTLGFDFWRAPKDSQVRKSLCEAISRALGVVGGITLFSVPDGLGAQRALLDASIDVFFGEIGLNEFAGNGASGNFESRLMTQKLKQFLAAPLSTRSVLYDTTLRVASPSKGVARLPQTFLKNKSQDIAISLPYWYPERFNSRGVLAPLLPLGFLLYGHARQHSVVFMPEAVLKTCGVAEDFMAFPVKSSSQKDLEKLIQAFWIDINSWARHSGSLSREGIEEQMQSGAVGKKFKSVFADVADSTPSEKKVLTGWMELAVFEKGSEEYESDWRRKCRRQQELIDDILDSKLDYVWVSLSPQMYYGVHAKNPYKKRIFEDGCKRFLTMLSTAAKDRASDKIPKVLIGYEVANNLYEPHLPTDYAIDMFGNQYRDVPNPAGSRFWQEEVIDPFQKFMTFIKTLSAEDIAPIGGVVLDLELYGRRLEGQFTPTMLCGSSTRKAFVQGKATALSPEVFMKKLTQQKLWERYQAFVEGQVTAIGVKIRQEIVKHCKPVQPIFAVYTPAVMTDWFNKSLFKGLVPPGKALNWFTFNTKFSRIKKDVELEFGGMRIDHSSVVMLSKVTDDQKHVARFLEKISQYNSGVWFNRWSRLVEPHDPGAWHYVEQPRMFGPLSKQQFRSTLSRSPLVDS